jgi:hypothetical protein
MPFASICKTKERREAKLLHWQGRGNSIDREPKERRNVTEELFKSRNF